MELSMIIQWLISALLVLAACWWVYTRVRNTFTASKFKDKGSGCDKNCGCS